MPDNQQEMSSSFPLKTMWRSYFCALVATAVLAVSIISAQLWYIDSEEMLTAL